MYLHFEVILPVSVVQICKLEKMLTLGFLFSKAAIFDLNTRWYYISVFLLPNYIEQI